MEKHTPTPWKQEYEIQSGGVSYITGPNEEDIARLFDDLDRSAISAEANAEFIITAVNHYDELVDALEKTNRKLGLLDMFLSTDAKWGDTEFAVDELIKSNIELLKQLKK